MPPVLPYRLYNEDCFVCMDRLQPGSVDMVLADLPYGTTQCKWDTVLPLDRLWAAYKRVCKPNAAIVLTASQPFTSALVMSNPSLFRHEWIWIKNRGSNFANTVREPFKEHESVLVFSEGRWTYNKQMQERTGGGAERVDYQIVCHSQSQNYRKMEKRVKNFPKERVPSSWQKFNTEVGLHPTQKPVSLMEYLIKTYSDEGDCVLDNCMGSGTTGVACMNLGRKFIGCDNDQEHGYYETATKRIREAYLAQSR